MNACAGGSAKAREVVARGTGGQPPKRQPSRRAERGLALITVILVLVALVIIVTPFALSMRNLESASLLSFRRERARAGVGLALAAARRHLEQTHPALDLDTPHVDRAAEIEASDLARRFPDLLPRDPRGSIRSVSIEDESGKLDLTRATPALLGNLLGGRAFLTADAGEQDDLLALSSSSGFPASGLALVGREQVEYSTRTEHSLGDLRRGFPSANLERSLAALHAAGTEVLDARLVLLAQRAWRVKPGVFTAFSRVDGLKQIALFSELAYDAETLDRVRPDLTVQGGPLAWSHAERVLGLRPRSDGAQDVLLRDGRHAGPGTLVRLTDGEGRLHFDLVLAAMPWGDQMRVTLLEGPSGGGWAEDSVLETLAPVPVNVNTASPRVLEALLAGLGRQPVADVITELEAVHLALMLNQAPQGLDAGEWTRLAAGPLQAGEFSRADLSAALALMASQSLTAGEQKTSDLALLLVGATSRQASLRIGRPQAAQLAAAIHAAQPASDQDLAALLDKAVSDGWLRAEQRDVVLINAIDPHDARLVGGTAPFCYASDGVFTLRAASSDNMPNGREQAVAHAREIVSVAPPGESALLLETQADFELAAHRGASGQGWTSFPNLMESGPGLGQGLTEEQIDKPRLGNREQAPATGSWEQALALGGAPPDRANGLIAGRAGPSLEAARSWVAPRPVRSALSGTLHFDEGAPGLTGSTPAGWDFAAGPLRLPTEQLDPDPTLPLDARPRPFSVSFWFTPDDPAGETMLFDAGADPLEDRVLIMLKDGELILRVSDHSVADFRGEWPDGGLPPAGEIRYGFDDGLALRAGVPYHVLAFVGGARSSQLALFVDGRARGRRSFTTRLLDDLSALGGPFLGSSSGQGITRLRVESTRGFPERGALRVGEEIMEYTSRTEDEFEVAAAGTTDPFGGRGRRGTLAAEHKASEMVELVGYTRPLASLVALAGNGSLAGELSEFGMAQLDPSRLTTEIEVNPELVQGGVLLDQPFSLGTGLAAGEVTIPVAASDGGSLPDGLFQTGGGYAILFCDYGDTAIVGQEIQGESGSDQWIIPGTDINGAWIGGAEMIRYGSYSGGTLNSVSRGDSGGLPAPLGPGGVSPLSNTPQTWVNGQVTSWRDGRSFMTDLSPHLVSELNVPPTPRVLVVPVSVTVTDSTDLYLGYHPGLGTGSQLTQIGLDFTQGGGGTEWIRWNTVTAEAFVRDDPTAVDQALRELSVQGLGAWDPNVTIDQGVLDDVRVQLGMRAQDGTPDVNHPDGEQVLPVIPFGGWGISEFDPELGVPGRHDFVSLIDEDGEREWNEINLANTLDPDWFGYCLVGLRAPVVNEIERSEEGRQSELGRVGKRDRYVVSELDLAAATQPGAAGERLMKELALEDLDALGDAVRRFNVDSRRLARLVCAPSGELPSLAPGSFHLGEDFDQRPSPGRAVVDELRIHVASEPGPLLPSVGRYLLDDELTFEEQRVAVLAVDQLLVPHTRFDSSRLGKDRMEILGELPAAGGLLLIDEEIVSYAGLDAIDSGAVFLTGRGLYGTRRAHHPRGSPVQPLDFWPASPLSEGLDVDGAELLVADPSVFPKRGGLLLVDDELIGYDERVDDALLMPVRPGRDAGGLLRGRFGTLPVSHGAGSMVRWMPARHADRALPGEAVPEARGMRLSLRTPGAFHTRLALKSIPADPLVQLSARAVLDGQGDGRAPGQDDGRVVELSADHEHPDLLQAELGRQGDLLELFLSVSWLPGAFDAQAGASNAWKLVPRVTDVVSQQIQPNLVLEHEEWR